MKSKPYDFTPLNEAALFEYDEEFAKLGITVNISEEFFFFIEYLLEYTDETHAERLVSLYGGNLKNNRESFQDAANFYYNLNNATIALIESLEGNVPLSEIENKLFPIIRTLMEINPEADHKQLIVNLLFKFLSDIIITADIDLKKTKDILKSIKKALGEDFVELYQTILALAGQIDRDDVAIEVIEDTFLSAIMLSAKFNEERKLALEESGMNARTDVQHRKNPSTGRNDPCPCGSGKKYKKCCLEKDEKENEG